MKRLNPFKSKSIPRLIIYQIKESPNYQGYVYLDTEYRKSSGLKNKKDAVRFLENWVQELQIKIAHGIPTSKNTIEKLVKYYLDDVRKSVKIESSTKGTIRNRFNVIKQCNEFMELDVAKCTESDVGEKYLTWMLKRKNEKGEDYRGQTIGGHLITISGFMTWCARKKYRDRPMSGLKNLMSKDLRNQNTSRDNISKDEYKILIKKSRERFKSARNKSDRFKREKLHYWIIFMCGTGLRTEECMTLHFDDVEMIDRGYQYENDDDRYHLSINIRSSKVKKYRQGIISTASAYFAYKRLMKHYLINDIPIEGNIWKVSNFRTGLNALLESCGLKFRTLGGMKLSRDSKSFRSFYIIERMKQGTPLSEIARNCGTSIEMIERHYAVYNQYSMIDSLVQTERSKQSKLKVVR